MIIENNPIIEVKLPLLKNPPQSFDEIVDQNGLRIGNSLDMNLAGALIEEFVTEVNTDPLDNLEEKLRE